MEERNEDLIKQIRNRQLSKVYTIIYVVRNEIKYNGDRLITKNMYSFIGIDKLGYRTIVDMVIERENDNHFWLDIFESFKIRGLEKLLFLSVTTNKDILRALKISFPETLTVPSITDNIYDIYKYVKYRSRDRFVKKIRNICIQDSIDGFKDQFDILCDEYKDNYIVSTLIDKKIKNISEYYIYNDNMRKFLFNHNFNTEFCDMINKYSSNNIVNHVNEIWNYIYEKIIYMEKYKSYPKQSWTGILNDLYLLFPNYLDYLIKE